MTALLGGVASAIAVDPASAEALQAGPDAAKSFRCERSAHRRAKNDIAVTVYDKFWQQRVGVGRASAGLAERNASADRVRGLVTQSALGLRLVRAPHRREDRRLGVVAVEHPLSPAPAGGTIALPDYELPTPIGPAELRLQYEGADDQPSANSFSLHAGRGCTGRSVVRPSRSRPPEGKWRRRVSPWCWPCWPSRPCCSLVRCSTVDPAA